MKGSRSGEEIEIKHKYVFFSDPETVTERVEKSSGIARDRKIVPSREQEQRHQKNPSDIVDSPGSKDLKYVESLMSAEPVRSHPFTFITAVKRKLALAAYDETVKRGYGAFVKKNENSAVGVPVDEKSRDTLYNRSLENMNFIKPLKVPDLKISPKTMDYAIKENSNLRDSACLKVSSTTPASQKNEKIVKSAERAHRKLDFSLSEGHSMVSSDDVEPLRAPEVSIMPYPSKQKDREKENRTKRMRKEDFFVTRMEDETHGRIKTSKHISRRDTTDSKRTRLERNPSTSANSSRDTNPMEFGSKRSRSKNFVASTLRKDDDRKTRSHTMKNSRERSVESRGRAASSVDSLADRTSARINEKISIRDQTRGTTEPETIVKHSDDYEILHALRQIDEQKQKIGSDFKQSRSTIGRSFNQQKTTNEPNQQQQQQQQQNKRIPERTRVTTSVRTSRGACLSSTSDNENVDGSNIIRETSDCHENFNQITDISNEPVSDPVSLDPTRISFRDDSYSAQDEFADLITPDMNLNVRAKRRKQPSTNEPALFADSEGTKNPKNRARTIDVDSQNSENSLIHPTALHMQFQAELHLFDSYNESLRQVEGVEKCLYGVNNERNREIFSKQRANSDETRIQPANVQAEREFVEHGTTNVRDETNDGAKFPTRDTDQARRNNRRENEADLRKIRQDTEIRDSRPDVRVAVTQTANDIATQTENRANRYTAKHHPGITYERGDIDRTELAEFSLGSLERFEDLERLEDISINGKIRALSEISMHETTSSIKTETGTEISISTRDVTCSFNKYLDHEMAQLIKDEKLMYDKIEMLFKSREKTLNDRTKKLVKLEEQKRALRDTGQDSRISSVKKKQRALLLKLQQEKDEMNRLKDLHKIASQERKLMLQKQRNMFNPQLSTKNILTKLKRSADCQSPRRLSGPMKGYDIRSNSSMSSLLESEKAQIDRSRMDMKILLSDYGDDGKFIKSDNDDDNHSSNDKIDATDASNDYHRSADDETRELERFHEFEETFVSAPQKLVSKTRKYEEKMPNSRTCYLLRNKRLLNPGRIIEAQEECQQIGPRNMENIENPKSESDTLVEELSKKSKLNHENILDQRADIGIHENIQRETDFSLGRKSKAMQVDEDTIIQAYRIAKKSEKIGANERDVTKKLPQQQQHEIKSTSCKRKGAKSPKIKSTQSGVLCENILRTKSSDEMTKLTNNGSKRTRMEKEAKEDNHRGSILEEIDLNESQNSLRALVKHSRAVKDKNYKLLRDIACERNETKENIGSGNLIDRSSDNRDNDSRRDDPDLHNLGNISTRSQVSTFTISRHSSGDSEKSYSRSVVIRAQDHRFKTSKKLEEALNAREAALVARRNCVEDWIAWHTKLKAEECRVARMEQAAFKLASTAANALSYNDTTMSSDTSDVEERVEVLAEKLAERRVEMARLRRETRKQARRKFKALELNLLNQIKKYDTTISEMQLKLETQKGAMRDSDRLAIESRSVEDFRVPEIPLKRIQELYKSSDLLRSRSESDLIFSKSRKSVNDENYRTTDDPVNLRIYENSRFSEPTCERTMNRSAESILEEAKKFTNNSSDASSLRETRETSVARSQESLRTSEESSNLRKSEVSLNRDDAEENIVDETSDVGESREISEEISPSAEINGKNSKLFSRKLESLHLTNKHLNDDISTLENDLRALSDMMLQFSKKSDDKLKSVSKKQQKQPQEQSRSRCSSEQDEIVTLIDSSPKNTSRDISEDFSRSIGANLLNEAISRTPEIMECQIIDDTKNFDHDENSFSTRNDIVDSVDRLVSGTLIDRESDLEPSRDIDFAARSKEILSFIEKSIISEHTESCEAASVEPEMEKSTIDENLENLKFLHNESSNSDERSIMRKSLEIYEENVEDEITKNSYETEHFEKSDEEKIPALRLDGVKMITSMNSNITDKNLSEDIAEVETLFSRNSMSPKADESFHESGIRENSSKFCPNEAEKLVDTLPFVKSPDLEDPVESASIEEEISIYRPEEENSCSEILGPDNEREVANYARSDESLKVFSANNEKLSSNDEILSEKISKTSNATTEMSAARLNDDELFSIRSNFPAKAENLFISVDDEHVERVDSMKFSAKHDDSSRIDELDDILDIMARESRENSDEKSIPAIGKVASEAETAIVDYLQTGVEKKFDDRTIPRPTDLNETAEVEPVLQKLTEILQGVERNIALRRKNSNLKINDNEKASISPSPIASKTTSHEIESFDETWKINLENIDRESIVNSFDDTKNDFADVNEKSASSRFGETKKTNDLVRDTRLPEVRDEESPGIGKSGEKTFDILRDPEYEDISEESLEISEILDRSESRRSSIGRASSVSNKIPEKYEIGQRSDDVLRILDEISQKSYDPANERGTNDAKISVRVYGNVSPGFANANQPSDELSSRKIEDEPGNDVESMEIEIFELENDRPEKRGYASPRDENSMKILALEEGTREDEEEEEEENVILGKEENYDSSELSEGADTPRGVSEIEMDSPRDPNESRLDIDNLDDDLLDIREIGMKTSDEKIDFPATTTIASSEKDIENMIDKLKASLEQPGLEVAELEAKLLRIEQLQIELEIKKLEAEEVSYYMREIPNKPPPPYTPPGGICAGSGVRTTTPRSSPSLPPAVVPSNVDELTAFTEKATIMIFNAKNSNLDITCLEPPSEIFQTSAENNAEIATNDRRIYNTFLFDLCKETIAELYRSEYEKPGPSWTKPNVKTKPAMKIPKTIDELVDHVSREVATLFGFKTKLQRENMVMRWSRKRRDRVDELLAREAQAEEDEWTKFHHDELAVKNELTVAILETLINETVNCVKAVHAKKRKIISV